MKEALAQTFIVGLIIFFFGILILLYFGTINYSKAFKSKNRIVTIVEKYGDISDEDGKITNTDFLNEIEKSLGDGGYQTIKLNGKSKCEDYSTDGKLVYPTSDEYSKNRAYDFCLIKKDSSVGPYYQVVTFMRFEVPLLSGVLVFPVRGETKVLCENIDLCTKNYMSNSN